VRTIIDRVDLRALLGKLLRHQFVHGVHERFWKVTAADAGLIGDYDDRQARFVQPRMAAATKGNMRNRLV